MASDDLDLEVGALSRRGPAEPLNGWTAVSGGAAAETSIRLEGRRDQFRGAHIRENYPPSVLGSLQAAPTTAPAV